MLRRIMWKFVLTASVAALVAVVLLWSSDVGREPRADLVGAEVATGVGPTTTVAPTSVPPPSPTTTIPPRGPAFPQRVVIPAIGVDSPVVAVGVERDGSMELPSAAEAGWYQFGAVPGADSGSAVIAAHVDANGRRGAFYDLRRLEVGATVEVTDREGAVRRFVVNERFQVQKTLLPAGELFRTDGPPTLTLITCGGRFDDSRRHYFDNIVVRAVPA